VALVLDTGVIYASLDGDDPDHESCAELLEEAREQLIIPAPVLVEVDYWVRKAASADVWLAFVQDIQAGAYSIYALDPYLLGAAAELQVRFADQAIGLVDAAVFASCEALGEDKVATLDQRHFSVLRTTDGRALRIVPE
jgi:predicted nucleic acid-binding protein